MTDTFPYLPLGALAPEQDGKRRFRLWAPLPKKIELVLFRDGQPTLFPMQPETNGYLISDAVEAPAGTAYGFYHNGKRDKLYPDPASRYQPDGVHGKSEVVDLPPVEPGNWRGRPLSEAVIYELHIGTFTEEGTFAAATERLDYVRDLGVTMLEIMPLNQTSGERNWGYDGVLPFALFQAYGRPEDFRRFVDAAHERGIAVLVDVIYNHLGPEGNYLPAFFPIFTEKHHTPWGAAINFDDAHADGVRNYWLQNVRLWLEAYGADGLRIDAVHAIKDYSAKHFLEEVSELADRIGKEQDRTLVTIAECDLNAPRYLQSRKRGGYGMSGQWVDEFHHAIHGLLTGEARGYYEDFGHVEQLAKALKDGYVYTGQYSPHRKRNFGRRPANDIRPAQMVVFLQNHDQVGNRMEGDRLISTIGPDKYLLGAATYLLSPFTPLIFMGEEYGEERPFPYFVHHGDPELIQAVRKGRAAEFAAFQTEGHHVPDPQATETFASAKLSWQPDERIASFYREALQLRSAGGGDHSFADISVDRAGNLITWNIRGGAFTACGNYGDEPLSIEVDSTELLLASNGATLENNHLELPAWGFAAIA
ncbi:malto-oligosyltrehalose trehalohydrolase [Neolewinella litorea]|uniref:Malto-oligosyltrehalose trehalohydrolase n=1 Tax=Neolewinella litorea TaxID=2562452 RepID=A0A4S4NKF6_9BACT|nr:malto-oligosyltrehalose trehalohydrolase [Neolewinella litorea]THH40279.1 malto-oligosyltrehalose trehalohydrolase [Neolewinella litorea]